MANRCIRLNIEEIQWLDERRRGLQTPSQVGKAEAENQRLKRSFKESEERYRALLGELSDSNLRVDNMLGIQGLFSKARPTPINVKACGKPREATAVAVFSDVHFEEEVEPGTVDGVNEYNLGIARRRCETFFKEVLSTIETQRKRKPIKELVLALIGDFISGYIHEELMEANQLSPTQAILAAYEMLVAGIDFILLHGGFETIHVPCKIGNHGRTTPKMRVQTAAYNSFEWLMYQFLRKHYAHEPRLKFVIGVGYHDFVTIYDCVLRMHHGDNVKYGGGVGGITIPLNKAIANWNTVRKADVDVLGHWHCLQSAGNYFLNGSVVGYGAYSVFVKAPFEPPKQGLFLVEPGKKKTDEFPIFL